MEEDDIASLRKRLIAKEGPLKRTFKKYLSFISTLETSTSAQSFDLCQNAYQFLVKEMSLFEFQIQKATVLTEVNQNELKYYDEIYKKREEDIEAVNNEIAALKERLAYEKIQRQYKEQYQALYKLINEKPSIEETES
eukprot:gene7031-8175_t